VTRALGLIEGGALDEGDVEELASRVGVGERQLRRLFHRHLGASPLAVAHTRRVLLATQLIRDTLMPMSEVALASGFGSVRRFNETFRHLHGRPPGSLRRTRAPDASATRGGEVTLRLAYRPPYDWDTMFSFLARRALPGVDEVTAGAYVRTFSLDGDQGSVRVGPGDGPFARATIRFPRLAALPAIIARIRRVFDLAADPLAIGAHLAEDPLLAPLVAARPGLRIPGAWDDIEAGAQGTPGPTAPLRGPDALPADDSALARALADREGRELTRAQLLSRAERWRPWRAYAAAHLRVSLAAAGSPSFTPEVASGPRAA
jgi:AraC family transcriptional regulator of adaptative response / DNA-3-methyladenine glycosylase II